MKKFRSQYRPRRAKKFMVAKKASSSPTPVLTSPDPARPMDTAHPIDTVPTPMDTASTPTMKKIRLASKYSKY